MTQETTLLPIHPINELLDPIVNLLKTVIDKNKPVWTGRHKLTQPLAHVTPQPDIKVFNLKDITDDTEKLSTIIELAFQYGVCQGYAIATNEHVERFRIKELILALSGSK